MTSSTRGSCYHTPRQRDRHFATAGSGGPRGPDGLRHPQSPRTRPHRRLRALRLLPADVPDVRPVGRGDGLPARAHPAHARRSRGTRPDVRGAGAGLGQLPGLHGLRDRVPVGRAVRQAHRGHARAGRAPVGAPARRAPAAPRDLRDVPPPRAHEVGGALRAPGRPDGAVPGPLPAPEDARAARAATPAPGQAARAHAGAGRAARARGVPAGLRAARVLRQRQRRDGRRAGGRGFRGVGAGAAALLWRPAAAHGHRCPPRGPRDDRSLRGLRHGRGQRGRMRFGDEGLRPPVPRRPGVGRARRGVQRQGARRHRAPGRARAARRAPPGADDARLSRRLPPRPRPAGPRAAARAASGDPGRRAARAGRVGAVLRLGGRVEPLEPRARGRARQAQGAQPARHGRRGRRRRQPGVRAADLRPRRPARPSPDGGAGRVDPREESMSVDVLAPAPVDGVLTDDALAFVGALHERFEERRRELLGLRLQRRARIAAGGTLDFLPQTEAIRKGDWQVAPPPADYRDRRVEITGPVDRKMIINALNSGARGFMADFEDSLSPTWANIVEGQQNLTEAIAGTIEFTGPDGREYRLGDKIATLLVRPRGWHLVEKHVRIDGVPVAGAFVDAGMYLFRNARALLDQGTGPYLYLPKMESHLEARLWADVLAFCERDLGLEPGTVKTTVLIETLPAAFEMEEILYELREHSCALNAGRWDYIFSTIKTFRERPEFVLPDRDDVKMTVPFMRAYTQLLVKTCHGRGAFAMGGMAALIPSRKDAEANERAIQAVREDKKREAEAGFDGTWVAHPDVVDVAMKQFDAVLGSKPNQIDRQRDDVHVAAEQLLDAASTPGDITEEGLRNDVSVGFQYISFWLGGRGAAGINNLMEDAATAEISRSQIWQWIHHGRFEREHVREVLEEEMARIRADVGEET